MNILQANLQVYKVKLCIFFLSYRRLLRILKGIDTVRRTVTFRRGCLGAGRSVTFMHLDFFAPWAKKVFSKV